MKCRIYVVASVLLFILISTPLIGMNNIGGGTSKPTTPITQVTNTREHIPPHPPTHTRGTRILFQDDVEGLIYWSGNFGTTDTQSHSPTHSWTDSPDGDYDTGTQYAMQMAQNIDLTNAVNPRLEFWYYIDADTGMDGGVVYVSTDGGQHWAPIAPSNVDSNYMDMSIYSALASQGVSKAYSGQSYGWKKAEFDLSPYVGTAMFRISFAFVPTPTYSNGGDGWYIDDILITADNTAPEAPVMEYQGNHTEPSAVGVVDDPIMLTWDASDPDGDPIRNYTVHVATVPGINMDNPAISDDAWVLRTQINATDFYSEADNFVSVDVEDGVHYYWAVKASDGFDWSPWSQVYDFVTNRPPVANISSISPQTPMEGEVVTFQGTGSDPDGDAITGYKWESSIDGLLGTAQTITATLSEGAHTISFSVRDANWEWSQPAEVGIVVGNNTRPKIVSFTPSNTDTVIITQGESQNFEVSVSDDETTDPSKLIKKWYLDGKFQDEGITYTLKTTVGGQLKDHHTVEFVVSDGVLSANISWEIYINAIPQIISKTPSSDLVTISELEKVDFSVVAKDDNTGDVLHYTWYVDNEAQEGQNSNSFTFYTDYNTSRTWPYQIKVEVFDSYNKRVKEEWSLIVENVVQPIVITYWDPYESNVEVDEGGTQVFQTSATSPDTTISYYWYVDGVYSGSGPGFYYTPGYDDAGSHTVKVVVKDENDDTEDPEHEWVVTVNNVNRNPVAIITLPDLNTYEAGAGAIPFDGSKSYDPDGDPLTYRWYDESGKVITSNADKPRFEAELEPGVRTITLEVTDPEGAKGIDRKIITILAPEIEITSMRFDRNTYYVGEGGAIYMAVRNTGKIDARDVVVTVSQNDNVISTFTLYISPGETENVVVPWTPSDQGDIVSVEITSPHKGVINTPTGKIERYLKPTVLTQSEKVHANKNSEIDPLLLPLALIIIIILIIDAIFILLYKDVIKTKIF